MSKRFLVNFNHRHGKFGDVELNDEIIISASDNEAAVKLLFDRYSKFFWISDFSVKELTEDYYLNYCKDHNYDKYVECNLSKNFLKR